MSMRMGTKDQMLEVRRGRGRERGEKERRLLRKKKMSIRREKKMIQVVCERLELRCTASHVSPIIFMDWNKEES